MNSKIPVKIVQHNLNKDRLASHHLREWCRAYLADFALLQEPLVQNGKIYAFENFREVCLIKDSGAVIIVLSDRLQALNLSSYNSNNTIAIRATYSPGPEDFMVLVSSYFKYNIPTILHTERLD